MIRWDMSCFILENVNNLLYFKWTVLDRYTTDLDKSGCKMKLLFQSFVFWNLYIIHFHSSLSTIQKTDPKLIQTFWISFQAPWTRNRASGWGIWWRPDLTTVDFQYLYNKSKAYQFSSDLKLPNSNPATIVKEPPNPCYAVPYGCSRLHRHAQNKAAIGWSFFPPTPE